MPRKRYTSEQIIRHLRQAEVLSSQHRSVQEICRDIGVSENTYYRWRKEYGGSRSYILQLEEEVQWSWQQRSG
jgi:transposase-like protein